MARPYVKAVGGRVLQTALDRVDLPSGCAAVLTLMDVLDTVDEAAGAGGELTRLLRPGGLLVVTVPALPWLWSDWDVALHHRRRYVRRDLVRLLRGPRLELLRCSYFNTAL